MVHPHVQLETNLDNVSQWGRQRRRSSNTNFRDNRVTLFETVAFMRNNAPHIFQNLNLSARGRNFHLQIWGYNFQQPAMPHSLQVNIGIEVKRDEERKSCGNSNKIAKIMGTTGLRGGHVIK